MALIRAHLRSGRCVLVGHSFGGVLAFEVAHQLQREGISVEMILMLDSKARDPIWWQKLKVLSLERARRSLHFRATHSWSRIRTTMASLVAASTAHNPSPSEVELLNDVPEDIFVVYRRARGNYRYRALDCRAVLFQCQDLYAPYAAEAWRSLFIRGLEIGQVPGNHVSLLQDPHVKVLGKMIIDLLKHRRAQKPSRLEPNLREGRRERAARATDGLNLEPSVERSSLG